MSFARIEQATVLLRYNGRYRECDVYERNGVVYAKQGSNFVKLYADGSTSVNRLYVEELVAPEPFTANGMGWVTVNVTDRPVGDRINFRRIAHAVDGE